jgi:protease I
MKNKSALLFLSGRDFNETEFKTVKSFLLRDGVRIFIVSDSADACVGESGLKVQPDVKLFNVHPSNYGAFILIGGKGINAYRSNPILHKAAAEFFRQKKIVAAICGAPAILAEAGILKGISAACHKDYKDMLKMEGASVQEAPVVVSQNIITASDDNAASLFAEMIVRAFKNI